MTAERSPEAVSQPQRSGKRATSSRMVIKQTDVASPRSAKVAEEAIKNRYDGPPGEVGLAVG